MIFINGMKIGSVVHPHKIILMSYIVIVKATYSNLTFYKIIKATDL